MMTMIHIRPAALEDSASLFEWRNDPGSREASINRDPVVLSDHEQWFQASLTSQLRTIYMAVDHETGELVGMVRFDLDDESVSAEVSINLNPAWRARGQAFPVLEAAIARFRADSATSTPLTATIRPSNRASANIFLRAGFTLVGTTGSLERYAIE